MKLPSNFLLIFIFAEILLLLHLPESSAQYKKKDKSRKVVNQPLVLLKDGNSDYAFPHCYRRDTEDTNRDFKANSETKHEEKYFCPNSTNESSSSYLYLTDDKDYNCKKAPDPMIRKITKEDDPNKTVCAETGDLYSYGYYILEKPYEKDQDSSGKWMEIYSFCYVPQKLQVVYLKHRILAPNLLTNHQLQRERFYSEGKYRLGKIDDETLNAYIKTLVDFKAEKNSIFTKMYLSHPHNMVFPNWRKPFYDAVNQGIILRKLKYQWKRIDAYVKKLAQRKLGEIDIIAGTLPYPDTATGPLPHPQPKLFGTWWKLVVYKNQAMAIILHNVYDEGPRREKRTDTDGKSFKPDNKTEAQPGAQNTNAIEEPKPSDNDPNGQPFTSQTQPSGEFPMHREDNFCSDICKQYGFSGLATKAKVHAYCCDPNVIADLVKLPKYEKILDLRGTWIDGSVKDDDCPNDPIQALISKGVKSPVDSEKTQNV